MGYKQKYKSRIRDYLLSEASAIIYELKNPIDEDHLVIRNRLKVSRNLSIRSGVRLNKKLRELLCKKCFELLIPGKTLRVRIKAKREKHVSYTCLKCGFTRRFILNKTLRGGGSDTNLGRV